MHDDIQQKLYFIVFGIDKQWKLVFVKSLRSKRKTIKKMRILIMQ